MIETKDFRWRHFGKTPGDDEIRLSRNLGHERIALTLVLPPKIEDQACEE
jgi:hypothetical protein